MIITNENFIRYFQKGKEAALEYVISEYLGIVKAVIHNTLKTSQDPQMIEECINDTFLGAYENAKQFNGNQEDFRKWICTIAKFKAIDRIRDNARTPATIKIEEGSFTVTSAEDEFILKETTIELIHIMNRLDKVDRNIFTMKYFLNMKSEEIAEQLGLTKASVDNRIYRGKKRLQKIRLGGAFHEKTI